MAESNILAFNTPNFSLIRVAVFVVIFLPLNLLVLTAGSIFQLLAVLVWVLIDLSMSFIVLTFQLVPVLEGKWFDKFRKFARGARSIQPIGSAENLPGDDTIQAGFYWLCKRWASHGDNRARRQLSGNNQP